MDLTLNVNRGAIPHFDCWIGAWAMHEPNFHAIREQLSALNLTVHLANSEQNRIEAIERAEDAFSTTEDGIGVINVEGSMMKHASSFSSSCSSVMVRRTLNRMAADENIRGIIMRIDSPGGTVAGTKELADAIASAKTKKPVWAYCNDLTASAAYWIASQCTRIEANPTALVGSIGTYCVVMDSSQAAESEGLKIHVVRAGEFKGMGTPGTEVTDDHLAELNAQVKALNTFFLDAVSTGRGMQMDQVSKIADGRVHIAAEAKNIGLIDDVSAFEDFFERFSSSVSAPGSPVSHQEEIDMTSENTAKPATLAEIDAKFAKASADMKLAWVRSGFTLAQCQESYCELLQAEVDAANKRAEAAQRAKSKPGHKALALRAKSEEKKEDEMAEDEEYAEDEEEMAEGDEEEPEMEEAEETVARWNSLVEKQAKLCGGNRMKATSIVAKKHPTLMKRMQAAVNAKASRVRRRARA